MSTHAADARLRVLEATELLDSSPEPAFDRLTRLAAHVLEAPVALVSLVDDHRQFFKSAFGLGEPWSSRRETPLSHSFCKHVAADRAPLVVPDARQDRRLCDNPAVLELGAVAYAGVPLTVDEQVIGAFCVLDHVPRAWAADQVRVLEDLAASVVSEIELRSALKAARAQRALTDAIIEGIGDACMAVDAAGRFLVVNQAARQIFEAVPGEPLPRDWAARHRSVRPDGSPLPSEDGALSRALRGHATDHLTFTLQRAGAPQPVWVEASGRPVRASDGDVVAAVAVYRDVTERKRSEQVYRAIVQHLPRCAVLMVDRDLRYVSADGPLLPEILQQRDLTTLVGSRVTDVVTPANRDAVLETFRGALAGRRQQSEMAVDGRFYEVSTAPLTHGDAVTHALMFSVDVTDSRREAEELRRARDSLAREQALLETMVAHIDDAVALLDADRRVLLANEPFAAMIGLRKAEIEGMPRQGFLDRLVPLLEDPDSFRAEFAETSPRATHSEYVLARPRRRVMRRTWTPVRLIDGDGYLVAWHDVTAERDLLRERERLLLVDALTGIPNRRAAEEALRVEHQRMKRSGTPMSVALFDVDHFKQVNDGFGHAVGDDVLRAVATTLAAQARLTDAVARWGGEEFVAVLNVPLDGARAFCERVRRVIAGLRCPPVERITISVVVTELAAEESVADALARADRCLYDAKEAGRNRVSG